MPFINENFMIQSKAGLNLYNSIASDKPIIDYHNHLPPADIAHDRQFKNLFEIWLEGDHYKWRAMRSNGISEELCTGPVDPFEKFKAFAATVPHTIRNPLYHWTHLELKRYFGIDELLSPDTAEVIWHKANEQLKDKNYSARGLLRKFKVEALCTTDDPADPLSYHEQISNDPNIDVKVLPAFRPDKALAVNNSELFNSWLAKLEKTSNRSIGSLQDLMDVLESRHSDFDALGAKVSDHGLSYCYAKDCTETEANKIFNNARSGMDIGPEEHEKYASFMMHFFGVLDAHRGWTKQLHLGALRNNNTRKFNTIGPDTGFDSIGDWPQAQNLSRYLDRLDSENKLPKIILYNLNPSDNYIFGSMIGNFQDGSMAGKIQLGSGWWFLDQKEGMEWQLNTLSNLGLLSRFIGMLTDSRSFMSFPRHEYFRRILCNLVGKDVDSGEIPNDESMLSSLIENICYRNVKSFLDFD